MSTFGKDLIESAKEALAIAEGKKRPARIVKAEDIDVAAIRKRLHLSQSKFAARFRLPVATIRDWEQKRRYPDRAAANLLRVIKRAPKTVARALAGTE
jgi:putative transcriptional regulator